MEFKTIKELDKAQKLYVINHSKGEENPVINIRIEALKHVLGLNFDELIEEVNQEETEEIGHVTFAQRCFDKFKSRIKG